MWLVYHHNSFCFQISIEMLCVFLEPFILYVLFFFNLFHSLSIRWGLSSIFCFNFSSYCGTYLAFATFYFWNIFLFLSSVWSYQNLNVMQQVWAGLFSSCLFALFVFLFSKSFYLLYIYCFSRFSNCFCNNCCCSIYQVLYLYSTSFMFF
jgi:hypothetical protein